MTSENLYELSIKRLSGRGVEIEDMSKLVIEAQENHTPQITLKDAERCLHQVLKKRETQYAVLTAIELDELAEKGLLTEPLLKIIKRDEPLYGVDETLATSIVNCYGAIAISVFGFLDVTKPGLIGKLDNSKNGRVNTFLDDIVCALVASACSRYAHNLKR